MDEPPRQLTVRVADRDLAVYSWCPGRPLIGLHGSMGIDATSLQVRTAQQLFPASQPLTPR
jgi:hypothetical protein